MLFSSFSRFPGSVLGVKNSKKAKSYSSFKKLSTWRGDGHLQYSECQEGGMGGCPGHPEEATSCSRSQKGTGVWEVE